MVLTSNYSFSIAATFIAVILLLIVSLNYSSSNIVNKRFKMFLISTIFMFTFDIVTAITVDLGDRIPPIVNTILFT
ncbi:MAG: hypothetical protein IJ787_01630, partial [Bacilli bacterium]|nr:hypothetical protein [Bacilli bacterium]